MAEVIKVLAIDDEDTVQSILSEKGFQSEIKTLTA